MLAPEVGDYIEGDATRWESEPMERLSADGQLKNLQKNFQVRSSAVHRHTAFFIDYENWFILPRQFL